MASVCCSRKLLLCPLLILQTLLLVTASSHLQINSPLQGYSAPGGFPLTRSLVETSPPGFVDGTPIQENRSFTLAADRTRRRDPLNGFKYYTGGWNINGKHYMASVGFTAAPYFIIAAAWFVGFGLILFFICCCYCCCPRRSYSYSRLAYALSLIILILFTIAAIIGSVFLYYGQEKFHDSISKTLDYVVSEADHTVETLQNFSSILSSARNIRVSQLSLPSDVQSNIDVLQKRISSSANDLDVRTRDNSKNIRHVLNITRNILIVIAAVMLLLAFLGFFFSLLGLEILVSILVIIGWILVAGTFILSGVFLLLHNVVTDSCVAMDEWVLHPSEHTTLDEILPCVDTITANESFNQSRRVTFDLINNINQVIGIANRDFPPGFVANYNQSGPQAPLLCNPLLADLSSRNCSSGEVNFMTASNVWRSFICQASRNPGPEMCASVGRFTPSLYTQLKTATNATYGLYNYTPFLKDLADCSFVRKTFTKISNEDCPDLKHNSSWVYIGLGLVSGAVMFSLIFWVIYARERRHRVYGK